MAMYMYDVCTIPSNLAGHPAVTCPSAPAPTGSGRRAGAGAGAQRGAAVPGGPGARGACARRERTRDATDRLGDGRRPRGALRAADGHQAVLRVPQRLRRRAERNICPVCLGLPGSLPVLNRRAVELALRIGAALQLQPATLDLPPQELLLSRHAEGLPDQPIRRADQRRRLARAARRVAGRHRAGPYGRGHGQDDPCRRRGGASTRPATRWSTTTGRACPSSRSSRALISAPRPRPGPMSTNCARSSWPPGPPTAGWRRAHAGRRQRLGAPGRHRAEFGTRCEIKNLNSLRSLGAGHRLRGGRQIALVESGETVRRRRVTWTRVTGARTRCAPRRRRTTTAISPSPT